MIVHGESRPLSPLKLPPTLPRGGDSSEWQLRHPLSAIRRSRSADHRAPLEVSHRRRQAYKGTRSDRSSRSESCRASRLAMTAMTRAAWPSEADGPTSWRPGTRTTEASLPDPGRAPRYPRRRRSSGTSRIPSSGRGEHRRRDRMYAFSLAKAWEVQTFTSISSDSPPSGRDLLIRAQLLRFGAGCLRL
jgi:hypothetical protein